jgi:ribose transport system permease protein
MSTIKREISKPERQQTLGAIRSRFGLVFAWVVVFILGAVAVPDTFLTVGTLAGILGSQAVLVFLALGILFPLTAGDYDLSIGGTLALTSVVLAILNVQSHVDIVTSILVALALGAAIGAVNGCLVVVFRIDPFIVTLGMATILAGLAVWVTDSNTLTGVATTLSQWTFTSSIFSVPPAFYYGGVVVILVWYILEFTTFGRRLLYIGRGQEVARLNGVNVEWGRLRAFVVSGTASAIAGVIYIGTTGSASPSSGSSYLLPAYAAAFLGATAILPGRFNAWGTLVAVYFLGTGITVITLLGADSYVQNLFYGGALIIAVILSQLSHSQGLTRFGSALRWRRIVREKANQKPEVVNA